MFKIPDGAEDEAWSIMDSAADESANIGPLVQATFTMDGMEFTARAQYGVAAETDISGMYYDWTAAENVTLANWGDGNMEGTVCRYVGDGEMTDLCTWYDIEVGISYSLSVSAADLDGFDIQAIAEMMYDPAKQIGANAPEMSEFEEYSIDFIKNVAKEAAPDIDITGCDTFTQIVDKSLSDGMGYVNEVISGNDVLLVSSGTYDNLDGNMAAIDAVIYSYKDGKPYEIGSVTSAGTAYPLTLNMGYLYTGSNHWICKYAISDDKLMVIEHIMIMYDEDGNATYYYDSEDGGDYSNIDQKEAEKIYLDLVDEMSRGTICNFSTVSK